jgi:hypothetical protein
MRIDSAIITGSFSVNGDTFNDLGVFPSTGSNTFVGNQIIVGAVSASALTGSIDFTNLTDVPTLVSGSEQIVGILSPLNSYTQSSTLRLNSLEEKTGSLATTGSNIFYGNQTISGTVYIQDDLIVQGSSSLQNITASAVSIGTNIVNLNTANPSIRFAGLSIIDSGSVGGSGSFLYDSLQDEFIFVHRGAATAVTSSVILMGPQTYDSIGNETYPTANRIQKGTGNEHLVDSCISDSGTLVTINSATQINSSISGCGTISTSGTGLNASVRICNTTTTTGKDWHSYSLNNGNFGLYNNTDSNYAYQITCTGVTTFTNTICAPSIRISGDSLFCSAGSTTINLEGTTPILNLTRNNNATNPAAQINFKTSQGTVRWQIATNQSTGTGLEINQGDSTNRVFYIDTSGRLSLSCYLFANGGGIAMDLNATDTKITNYGYGGGIVLRRSDADSNRYGRFGIVDSGINWVGGLQVNSDTSATFSNKVGVGGASATYSLTAYNSANGTTAAFGGTARGIRIDNDGTFSNGRSTIYGVDNTFYNSYQPLAIGGSELHFSISGVDRVSIASSGVACFSGHICAPSITTTGANSSIRGGDSALFRGSVVTQSGNNVTFDAFRFLNPTGGVGGAASSLNGRLFMSFSDTATGGNQVSYQYLIITTGNGVSPGPFCFALLYSGPVRGTNPISSISLVNDGEGGAVKVRATTAASGVAGASAHISFVGTAV